MPNHRCTFKDGEAKKYKVYAYIELHISITSFIQSCCIGSLVYVAVVKCMLVPALLLVAEDRQHSQDSGFHKLSGVEDGSDTHN